MAFAFLLLYEAIGYLLVPMFSLHCKSMCKIVILVLVIEPLQLYMNMFEEKYINIMGLYCSLESFYLKLILKAALCYVIENHNYG